MRNTGGSSGSLSSVSNALRVLDMLGDGVELRVVDVAKSLGVANATAHRVLTALKDHGFVRQVPDSTRYLPGPAVLRLARRISAERTLRTIATPHLQALCRDLKETINLEILVGSDVLFIASAEDQHRLRVVQRAGTRGPAYANAGGKVLLSELPDDEVRHLVGDKLQALTSHTVTAMNRLLADLEQVRQRGYGMNVGETDEGVHAVAVPVVDHDRMIAALSLAAPEARLPSVRVPMVVPRLLETAAAISADYAVGGPGG
ncbi:IclR family transcriptional regulator [Streptomyces sp. NPDC004227]